MITTVCKCSISRTFEQQTFTKFKNIYAICYSYKISRKIRWKILRWPPFQNFCNFAIFENKIAQSQCCWPKPMWLGGRCLAPRGNYLLYVVNALTFERLVGSKIALHTWVKTGMGRTLSKMSIPDPMVWRPSWISVKRTFFQIPETWKAELLWNFAYRHLQGSCWT